jgi:hypothetical protein
MAEKFFLGQCGVVNTPEIAFGAVSIGFVASVHFSFAGVMVREFFADLGLRDVSGIKAVLGALVKLGWLIGPFVGILAAVRQCPEACLRILLGYKCHVPITTWVFD